MADLKSGPAVTKVEELLDITGNAIEVMNNPFFLLDFKGGVEVRQLEGEMRVINFSVPAVMADRVRGQVSKHYKQLSQSPLVANADEDSVRMVGLVPNVNALRILADSVDEDFYFSREGAHILSINGAMGMIGEEWQYNLGNLPYIEGKSADWEKVVRLESKEDKTRLGPCSYLTVDLRKIETNVPETLKRFLAHLSFLHKSPDFVINFDGLGNLVIIALNERSVGILSQWAITLEKIIGKVLHCYIGKGEIERGDTHRMKIKGYLDQSYTRGWLSLATVKPSVYSLPEHLDQIKGGRDETAVELVEAGEEGVFRRVEIARRNLLRTGRGPDRLIGYTEEIATLREALAPSSDSKLILIEGQAGTGKSRLIDEAIDKRDQKLIISMDPAGRNIPGFSVVNFLDQITNFVKQRPDLSSNGQRMTRYLLEYLENFSAKDENEKLIEVNSSKEAISTCCDALLKIADLIPELVIVIDDVHHIDRHSDGQIMEMIDRFTEDHEGKTKIVLARRPEARYASLEQDNLLRKFPNKTAISLHKADGRLKIDFNDADIAREYAFYSLPEWLRINRSDRTNKVLGEWAETLGQSASTPFEMSSFMHSLLDNIDVNFLIQKDSIELTDYGYERISRVKGSDLLVYHLERMREQLSPQELEALQAIAMLGQRLSREEELTEMLEQALGMTEFGAKMAIDKLVEKNYLKVEEEEAMDSVTDTAWSYKIWHENIRDIALNNSLDEAGRALLAEKLLAARDTLNGVSNLQYFEILNFAAQNKNIDDEIFWRDYKRTATQGMDSSNDDEQYNQGYAFSNSVLNGLGKADYPKLAIGEALSRLKKGETIPESLDTLIYEALWSLAKNGYYLGKFAQVYQAVDMMEEFYKDHPKRRNSLQQIYRIGFNAAMAQDKKKLLRHYYDKIDLNQIDPEAVQVIKLKLAYREDDKQLVKAILDVIMTQAEVAPTTMRMLLRVETQQIIENTKAENIDGDIILAGRDLSDADRSKAAILLEQLRELRERISKNGERILPPIDELQMLDMEGELSALNGDYQSAVKCFKEYWRIAMQMEVYPEAVRAAKQQGDLEVISAIALEMGRNKQTIPVAMNYRRLLKGAVEIYSEEGIFIAERTEQDFWKFLLCVQRLRAICLFLDSLDSTEFTFEKEEATRYLVMAAQDITFLNEKPWVDYVPTDVSNVQDFETAYYITPLFKSFEQICVRHRVTFEQPIGAGGFGSDFAVKGSIKYMEDYKNPDMMDEYVRKAWSLRLAQKKTQD